MDEPPGFEVRAVALEPGGDRIYNESEWRDAMVVVARGEIELEYQNSRRHRFERGDVLWLCRLPLRALHNRGTEDVVLVAVSRRRRGDEFSAPGLSKET
jgi:quercetin dioxygenase-like cupin family protein